MYPMPSPPSEGPDQPLQVILAANQDILGGNPAGVISSVPFHALAPYIDRSRGRCPKQGNHLSTRPNSWGHFYMPRSSTRMPSNSFILRPSARLPLPAGFSLNCSLNRQSHQLCNQIPLHLRRARCDSGTAGIAKVALHVEFHVVAHRA